MTVAEPDAKAHSPRKCTVRPSVNGDGCYTVKSVTFKNQLHTGSIVAAQTMSDYRL